MAENLERRRDEFSLQLQRLTDCGEQAATEEVELSIERIFHWAAYADKYGGTVQVRAAANVGRPASTLQMLHVDASDVFEKHFCMLV